MDDPNRSMLAQLLMNIFNGGKPFQEVFGNQASHPLGGGAEEMAGGGAFPEAPQGGAPLDMSVAGMWGAGNPQAQQQMPQANVPTPSPRPQQPPAMKGRMNPGMY